MECRNNTSLNRFEAVDAGEVVGWVDYEASPETLTMTHTIVPSQFSGRGIGKVLAEYAVGYAAEHGWAVVPECTFIRAYIAKNPQFMTLVPDDKRHELFPDES